MLMPNIQVLFTRFLALIAVLVLAGCAGLPGTSSREGAQDTSMTIDLTVQAPDAWERIRRGYAIPNLNTPLVDKWTAYYARHPEAMNRMANRAGKYLYYIVEEINRRGLPTELALLPFVESAFNPIAYSHAKASGLWQFIPSTGTQFKLKQDWWHDQRRDPIASTNAALDYLEYLFEFQGDWYLALASYNWGEGAVICRSICLTKRVTICLNCKRLKTSSPILKSTRWYYPMSITPRILLQSSKPSISTMS